MRRNRLSRRAFSLVEALVSVMLVGLLIVAGLKSLDASTRRGTVEVDRLRARSLASDFLNEILLQPYQEPDGADHPLLGPESGEATGNRTLFDDVDDYAGWTSSPPSDPSGMPIPSLVGWTRSVSVQWADPTTLAVVASPSTGLKKITVTVQKGGGTPTTLIGYRSFGWTDTIPTPNDTVGNSSPVAVATSPDLTRSVGQTVQFSAATSSDSDGDYLSYVWNYGDGTTGTGASVTKIYTAVGSYTCTLTVYDGRGGVGIATLTAVISP